MSSNPDHIIEHTYEDGTVVKIDVKKCELASLDLLERVFELEDEDQVENYHAIATVYSLFNNCVSILLREGWNPENLKTDIEVNMAMLRESMN